MSLFNYMPKKIVFFITTIILSKYTPIQDTKFQSISYLFNLCSSCGMITVNLFSVHQVLNINALNNYESATFL